MEQVPKHLNVHDLAVQEFDQKEDQISGSSIYKIKINNLQVCPNQQKISCRSSQISNFSNENSDLSLCKFSSSHKQDAQHTKTSNLTLNNDESNHINANKPASSRSIKSVRSTKLQKPKKSKAEIQKKLKSHNYKDYKIDLKENGDYLVTMQSGQKILIRNSSNVEQKPIIPPGWERQNRIGCCCFSMSKQTFCFSCCMISSLCICIQTNNICCFCQDADCSYCCITDCCRQCCFQKTYGECCLQCCKSLPCCTMYDCLINGKQCNCNCLKTLEKITCGICMYCGKCLCAAAICLCICFK